MMQLLTDREIRIAFREMTRTGDKFQKNLGLAGLYADDKNRERIYSAFEKEVIDYLGKYKQEGDEQ